MTLDDFWPMTDGMERVYGSYVGGYLKDECTTACIAQHGSNQYVVLGPFEGQWGAELNDENGDFVAGGYGDTPQEALMELRDDMIGELVQQYMSELRNKE